jgi:putative serine protease PepD
MTDDPTPFGAPYPPMPHDTPEPETAAPPSEPLYGAAPPPEYVTAPLPGAAPAPGPTAPMPAPLPGPAAPVAAPMPEPERAMPAPQPAPKRARVGFWRLLLAALVGGLVSAAGVAAVFSYGPLARPAVNPALESTPKTLSVEVSAEDQPIEAAAAKVLPSVLNVAVSKTVATPFGNSTSSGVASGIIVRSDGYVLTNNHVVEGADKIVVRLGTDDVTARVVGTDPSSDLAVIKVDRTGLPAATLGTSGNLQVGQTVVALGSPFGLDKTVTSGIISALHRSDLAQSGTSVAAYTNLIQTDAAINPGNSGGALVDLLGRVVGVNTLIFSNSGSPQSAGIGFAIPVDYAKSIADQLIAGKKVEHPYMGISAVTIDESLAAQYGLPVTSGALVQNVAAGSPAERAGLKDGDIIVKVGGQPVRSFEEVLAAIRSSSIGQTLSVEVIRKARHLTVNVTLVSDQTAK